MFDSGRGCLCSSHMAGGMPFDPLMTLPSSLDLHSCRTWGFPLWAEWRSWSFCRKGKDGRDFATSGKNVTSWIMIVLNLQSWEMNHAPFYHYWSRWTYKNILIKLCSNESNLSWELCSSSSAWFCTSWPQLEEKIMWVQFDHCNRQGHTPNVLLQRKSG